MIVERTFSETMALLEPASCIYHDLLVPGEILEPSHHPYREEYGWLFVVERRIRRILSPFLEERLRNELVGSRGILSEVLSNAYCHGHRRKIHLPIEIGIFNGKTGLLIQVLDQGTGFHVPKVISGLQRGHGYFHNAGNGMRLMSDHADFEIFFDDEGRSCNILYRRPV
ncbi:MAG: hypothetical protein CVU59_04900 [Deltaproteobacteria bacterium HGW-Deltaproteobacteria-17]|nr:MAG: hypothetical protein CVU59_04900 [Deltaproteobacteria bacterium HGW-Deltaproteobacteria-17]